MLRAKDRKIICVPPICIVCKQRLQTRIIPSRPKRAPLRIDEAQWAQKIWPQTRQWCFRLNVLKTV